MAVCTTTLAVVLGTPAAYALARFEFRGKQDLWFWFITNRFVSPVVLAFPVFLISRELGLRDTHLALILMYLTFTLPIVIWICTDQFRSIPRELDEAALLEGASQWRIFRSICLPLAMPGVAVSSILSFIFSWNELLFAYILAPKAAKTAPAMAITFMEGYDVPYGKIMATSTLIVIPVLIFALIASKHLVAIARALSIDARVVIMDEPTAALGVKEGNMVLELIRRVRDKGLPVVLISHNMPHVFEIADRIHVARLGKRAAVLNPKTISMSDTVAVMTGAMPPEAISPQALAH